MSRHSTFMRVLYIAGAVGLLAVAPGASTGSAQSVNDMVRTLNNVLNPVMLNGWKTRHVGTVDHKRSVTGAIIAQG